jgi:hypothetical protein
MNNQTPTHKEIAQNLGERIAAQHWERAGVTVPKVPTLLEFLQGRIASNHSAVVSKDKRKEK